VKGSAALARPSIACGAAVLFAKGERAPDYVGGTDRFIGHIMGTGSRSDQTCQTQSRRANAGLPSGSIAVFAFTAMALISRQRGKR
jgi:hypothetical protein